jgi:hypothetical protein
MLPTATNAISKKIGKTLVQPKFCGLAILVGLMFSNYHLET